MAPRILPYLGVYMEYSEEMVPVLVLCRSNAAKCIMHNISKLFSYDLKMHTNTCQYPVPTIKLPIYLRLARRCVQ